MPFAVALPILKPVYEPGPPVIATASILSFSLFPQSLVTVSGNEFSYD